MQQHGSKYFARTNPHIGDFSQHDPVAYHDNSLCTQVHSTPAPTTTTTAPSTCTATVIIAYSKLTCLTTTVISQGIYLIEMG